MMQVGIKKTIPAASSLLLLEDGHIFGGQGFGFANVISLETGQVAAVEGLCAELCFNTGMSGYQEVLSDPSYAGQIVCFSFPHIGNVGINREDYECKTPHLRAMISREYPSMPSNWRSEQDLDSWLQQHRVSGICGVDTRALVQHLRRNGSMRALVASVSPDLWQDSTCLAAGGIKDEAYRILLQHLRTSPKMHGQELSSTVGCRSVQGYEKQVIERWSSPCAGPAELAKPKELGGKSGSPQGLHVAVLDFGVKENILRLLRSHVPRVSILPMDSTWENIAALQPDGLFLSNGPGDPEPVYTQVAPLLEQAFARKLPVFGICLGHQILALGLGGKTVHMHHGHRGINHPVLHLGRRTVEITSQNHGFCVAEASLPQDLEITHRSLFDQSIEGVRSRELPVFSVQYHPESSPGPHDSQYLFAEFVELMEKNTHVC